MKINNSQNQCDFIEIPLEALLLFRNALQTTKNKWKTKQKYENKANLLLIKTINDAEVKINKNKKKYEI